jgi:hypothetical protein
MLLAQVSAGQAMAEPITEAHLLATPNGALAWFAANAPLHLLRTGENDREITEVRCSQPVSLVPASDMSMVAACRPGQLWRIGSGTHNLGTAPAP